MTTTAQEAGVGDGGMDRGVPSAGDLLCVCVCMCVCVCVWRGGGGSYLSKICILLCLMLFLMVFLVFVF